MAENLVTLVVASYNHADYIPQCLQSVAAQTLHDFDLIVTDDASTDRSQQVIQEQLVALSLDARLIFHDENRGICATFNEALDLVRTPFVAFLAADDWMVPQRLDEQVRVLQDAPESTALVYCDLRIVNSDGAQSNELYSERLPASWGFGLGHDLFPRLLRNNWIPAPSVMSRTEALREVGGYDPDLEYEDHDMWLRLSRRYEFAFINQALVYYRTTPRSLWEKLSGVRSRDRHLSRAKILSKQIGVSSELDDFIRTEAFRHAVTAYRKGARPSAVRPYLVSYCIAHRSAVALAYAALSTLRIPGTLVPSIRKASVASNAS